MNNMAYFIGGPLDGQQRELPNKSSQITYSTPKFGPIGSTKLEDYVSIREVRYKRVADTCNFVCINPPPTINNLL